MTDSAFATSIGQSLSLPPFASCIFAFHFLCLLPSSSLCRFAISFHPPSPPTVCSQPSFFAWFLKSTEEGYDEVGDAIKDEIWPNPLQFYLGEDDGDDDEEDGGEDEVGAGLRLN